MNENINTLKILHDELSKDYSFNMLVVTYYIVNDRSNIDIKIKNTITIYCELHPDFDIDSFNKFLEHLVNRYSNLF